MRLFATLTLLTLAACAVPKPVPGHAERLPDGGGLRRVARITPYLYRGAQPDTEGYRTLRSMGVRTVISFREFFGTRERAEAAGLRYIAMPLHASFGSEPPTRTQIRLFFETVLNPANQPVYFHCMSGKDRTGTMAALFRIERQGWTNEAAIAEMQAFGFRDVFRDLLEFVREYRPRGFAPPR